MRRLAGPRRPEGGHAALYLGLGLREPIGTSEVELVMEGEPCRGGRRGLVYNPDAPKVKAAQLKLFT